MRTENDIRSALATLADDVPPPEQVLAAVRTARLGRQRRRRAVVALAVATTAIAAISVPVAGELLGDRRPSGQPAGDPVPARPANPVWQHRFALGVPAGFKVYASWIRLTDESIMLSGPAGETCSAEVFAPGKFDPRELATVRTPVTVQGRHGWYTTLDIHNGARPRVAWQYAANAWAMVACTEPSGESLDASLRLANSLTFGRRQVPAPFAIEYVPAGLAVDAIEPMTEAGGNTFKAHNALGSRGSPRLEIGYVHGTSPTATVTPQVGPSNSGPKSLTINGRPATLTTGRDSIALVITGEGFQAQVSIRRLDDAANEAVRVAEGLSFAADPEDATTWFDATEALP